jgi:cell division protein FtsW (lipid II flippase)
VMIAVAQAQPEWYRSVAPWLYAATTVLLILVLLLGDSAKGAQRWLDFGVLRFQPSELMKLALPMTVAAYLHYRVLPPRWTTMLATLLMIGLPSALIMRQPDLGTALLAIAAGGFALFFAGLRWRWILGALLAAALSLKFFIYVFINIGMVIGLLPVVGVPLPLISYGGTSAVSLLAGFGMLMSIQMHRKLLSN